MARTIDWIKIRYSGEELEKLVSAIPNIDKKQSLNAFLRALRAKLATVYPWVELDVDSAAQHHYTRVNSGVDVEEWEYINAIVEEIRDKREWVISQEKGAKGVSQ